MGDSTKGDDIRQNSEELQLDCGIWIQSAWQESKEEENSKIERKTIDLKPL